MNTNRVILRSDFEKTKKARNDTRPPDRIIAHYELERTLAKQLLQASPSERTTEYARVYSELFKNIHDHPQHTKRSRPTNLEAMTLAQYLRRHVTANSTFLEIGCGDAALSLVMAGIVSQAIALDVTDELIDFENLPINARFTQTTGTDVALDDESVDVAFSNQLIEHLHPDDALQQLREILRVLKPGGMYRIATPNRTTGPHDISVYVDQKATGLHLREYDSKKLATLLRQAGFKDVSFKLLTRNIELPLPRTAIGLMETTLDLLPPKIHGIFCRMRSIQVLLGLTVDATK